MVSARPSPEAGYNYAPPGHHHIHRPIHHGIGAASSAGGSSIGIGGGFSSGGGAFSSGGSTGFGSASTAGGSSIGIGGGLASGGGSFVAPAPAPVVSQPCKCQKLKNPNSLINRYIFL